MSRRRREEPDGLRRLREIQRVRDAHPLPQTVSGFFQEGGNLKPEYVEHRPATKVLERYHSKANGKLETSGLALIAGVKQAMKQPLMHNQIVHRYPWAVIWVRRDKRTRKRVRGYKKFTTLMAAVMFQQRILKVAPNATVVSRSRGYDVPAALRGRIPRPFYWCPHCMKPRKFKRDPAGRTFSALKKYWNEEKQKFDWKERQLALLVCPMCRCTNREEPWRRSNQPWEIRRIKSGTRRLKRRR